MEHSTDTTWALIAELLENEVSLPAVASIWIPQPENNSSSKAIFHSLKSSQLNIWQTFRPAVLAFDRAGVTTRLTSADGPYDLAIIVPTRQRTESLAHIAQAWKSLKPDGVLLFACANDQGARGYLGYLKEVFPDLEAESKRKCRYALLRSTHIANPQVLNEWIEAAQPHIIPGSNLVGTPGIFGWNKIDRGSEILADVLPSLKGKGADLGSGYGFLSHEVLKRSPEVSEVHLVEAEARALDCARRNLSDFASKCHFHWLDVTCENLPQQLDWIVMNPPFHQGHETNSQLGQFFINVAARSLRAGGELYLVANKFLAYEDVLDRNFKVKTRLIEKDGFKVIHAQR